MGKRAKRRAELELRNAEARDAALRHGFDAGGMLGHDSAEWHVNVTEQTALSIDVFYACVRTLADAVAGGSVGEWRGTEPLDPSALVRRPYGARGWTRRRWLWRAVATLACYNVFRYRRVGRRYDGTPMDLVPLHPHAVSYSDRPGHVLLYGRETVPEDEIGEIWRADWPSVSPELGTILQLARNAFAAAWAADAYRASYWENGGAPSVILTTDQAISGADAVEYRDRWTERRRDAPGAPAVLGKGLSAEAFGADAAGEGTANALDRMGQSIARYLGVGAWIVNVPSAAGSMVYSNSQSAGVDLVRYSLDGYIGPIEDAWSGELPGSEITGRTVRIDVSELTMGTMLERFQAYQIATGGKAFMYPSEVRDRLDLPPSASLDLDPAGAPAPAIESIPGGI